jgi:hypothetical protein
MFRVIEHLGLTKLDLRENIADAIIQNQLLSEIVEECKDDLKVRLLNDSIADNEDIIDDSRKTLVELSEAIEVLQAFTEMSNKKRP